MSTKLVFTVEMDVDGDTEQMVELVSEYLSHPEGSFMTDYGPDAWGGHEGPTVTNVVVRVG